MAFLQLFGRLEACFTIVSPRLDFDGFAVREFVKVNGLPTLCVPPRAVRSVNGPTKPDRLCLRGGAPYVKQFVVDLVKDRLRRKLASQTCADCSSPPHTPALVMRNLWSGGNTFF
ncbi:hypothetical protein [Roseimaritima multifibrata]|uniref:hypothetical protein n=1 Tax=Roseimaritima multifibrata TaxID=1930274 RepID=UPI001C54D791|nr:hypothetical protein [Roseimaritima multifibrata]